jgi:histidyl-tRNA synthetase
METVKGFKDIENSDKRIAIRNIIEDTFKLYGFLAVETPIVEYEEFVRGDNASDEAVSDVFKLQDKGGRNLALRYEFTFQLKRLALNKKLPFKRFQIGPVFRDEPTTGNRWRQFTQCDIDIVGSTVKDEAEVLKITSEILTKLGISKFIINVNNRKLLNEILLKEDVDEKYLMAVIKEIDKLDKFSEDEINDNLARYNAQGVLAIFKQPIEYFQKYEAYKEIKELVDTCSFYGVKVNFVPFLARGLSYYNGSVFEVKSDIKETITAGGSFMVNGIQSTGISFGLERLELLAQLKIENKKTLVISIGNDQAAIQASEELRKNNIPALVTYGKISKALDYANSYNIKYVLFVGDEEVKTNSVKFKNMVTGKESILKIKDAVKEIQDDKA